MNEQAQHHHGQGHAPAERIIECRVVTRAVYVSEGRYITRSSQVFQGRNYTEGTAIGVMEADTSDVPLDALVVPATMTASVFEDFRDSQAGNEALNERPDYYVMEGSAIYQNTRLPVDETHSSEDSPSG